MENAAKERKIPKIIHYVWVGGNKMPEHILKCVESFKKFHPDYKIIEWNENNFDISSNQFVKIGIENKNWALASDVIRIWALLNYGGIYLDTDAEVIKPLDEFLDNEFFMGYENHLWANTAVIGAVKGHRVIKEAYERYSDKMIEKISFSENVLTVHNFDAVLKRLYGVKLDGKTKKLPDGIKLYSSEFFYPQHYLTLRTKITPNTHVIHHYLGTWHSKGKRIGAKIAKWTRIICGKHIFGIFERIARRSYMKTLNLEYKQRKKSNTDEIK